jgi:hypothetical protein
MGWRKRDTGPARKTFVTGAFAPSAEGGTAFLRRAFLRFFFLLVSLLFDKKYLIMDLE